MTPQSSTHANSTASSSSPIEINPTNTLRIILQNPHGIHPHITSTANNDAHINIRNLHTGILCLPETNTNWCDANNILNNNTTFRLYHRAAKIAYSSQKPHGTLPSHYFPGGTITAALGPWVSRVTSTLADPSNLGRWSGLILQGRHAKPTAIITCYRVPESTLSSAGPLTSFRRQAASLAESNTTNYPNPRQQCLTDLSTQINTLTATNHDIILCIDANEPLTDKSQLIPFLRTTGLHPITNSSSPPMPSTKRGTRIIDHFFVTQRVTEHIRHHDPLPFDSVFESDHRPIYIDIEASLFLTSSIHLTPATQRVLHSTDITKTNPYIETFTRLLKSHKIPRRLHDLSQEFLQADPEQPHTLIQKYETIDREVGEFMVAAEKACKRPRNNTPYDWSPKLKACANDLKYLKRQAKASPHIPLYKTMIREKRAELTQLRKDSKLLRLQFLSLKSQSQAPQADIIKKLIKTERDRASFNQLKFLLSKPRQPLTRVLYNENNTTKSTCDPITMESLILARNQSHLGQAHNTPFTINPGASLITPSHDNWTSLLESDNPNTISHDIQQIIQTLKTIHSSATNTNNDTTQPITLDEFKDQIQETPERTSSSPSGRHMGHYKTATQSTLILSTLKSLTSIPFQFGFSPTRWQVAIDTMLEKTPGNPHLSKLRIIQLLEADFNIGLKILWARRLRPILRNPLRLESAQHGCRPSHSTVAPTLNKILTYDINRTSRSPGIFLENDASAAFDRVVPALATLTSFAHGIPFPACRCLYTTTTLTRHHVRTGYGVSSGSYTNTLAQPIYGCGQGSGASPIIWILNIDIIFKAIANSHTPGSTLHSPSSSTHISRSFDAFVDDTCISATDSPTPILAPTSQHTHQHNCSQG